MTNLGIASMSAKRNWARKAGKHSRKISMTSRESHLRERGVSKSVSGIVTPTRVTADAIAIAMLAAGMLREITSTNVKTTTTSAQRTICEMPER